MPEYKKATTVADMKANFPAKPNPIIGKPNLQELVRILLYLMRCAQTHQSTVSPTMNLLYVAVPPEVYAYYTAEDYPEDDYPYPAAQPTVADYTACVNDNDRARVSMEHAIAVATREDVINMNVALTDTFLDLVDATYRAQYDTIRMSRPNAIFRNVFQYFLQQYGTTQAEDRHTNKERMAADWNPSEGFQVLTDRIHMGMQYALFAFHPIADIDVVDIAERVVARTSLYNEEMKAWNKRDGQSIDEGKTWNDFKTYWAAAIANADVTSSTSAASHGFGMSSVSDIDEQSYNQSVANFSNAHQATQTVIKQLTDQNAALQNQMMINQQQMQQQMNSIQQMVFATANQPYQQPYQPYQQQYQPKGKKQNPNNNNISNNRDRAPNPVKRHENWFYCWTHGCDVSHESSSCPKPGAGHMWNATRGNRMGGTDKGGHKTMLPSQAGRRPYQPRGQYNNPNQQQPQPHTMMQQPMMPMQQMPMMNMMQGVPICMPAGQPPAMQPASQPAMQPTMQPMGQPMQQQPAMPNMMYGMNNNLYGRMM